MKSNVGHLYEDYWYHHMIINEHLESERVNA